MIGEHLFPGTESPERIDEAAEARTMLGAFRREGIRRRLSSHEDIDGARRWRRLDDEGAAVRALRSSLELRGASDSAVRAHPDKREQLIQALRDVVTRAETGSPRVDELVRRVTLSNLEEGSAAHPEVQEILSSLAQLASNEGETNAGTVLTSSDVPWGTKEAWVRSHLVPALRFLERKDREDARRSVEAPESSPGDSQPPGADIPPPDTDTFQPSMEELGKGQEGEARAYFRVGPFYGGYFRGVDYASWNDQTLSWERGQVQTARAGDYPLNARTRRVMTGVVRPGHATALPMPYGFRPDLGSLRTSDGQQLAILEDDRGGLLLQGAGDESLSFSLEIGRTDVAPQPSEQLEAPTKSSLLVSSETEQKLAEIAATSSSLIERARRAKAYVRSTLKYSNESAMNAVYLGGDPREYLLRIEQHRKADCDVANTYFAALLGRLGVSARMVTGHYVKVKDRQGAAALSSGTAHAWVEVWDGTSWKKLDATPPGDPGMDDEEVDEATDDRALEGDFGDPDAEEISDEELEKMMAEAERALKHKHETREDTAARVFAQDAECSPEEARTIIREIAEARQLRDRRGRNIRARITETFQKIVIDNLVERLRYKAPVRLSHAHELADPVEAILDVRAGASDPGGFARREKESRRERVYGGFDVMFVVDKSRSMDKTDGHTGMPKWHVQQRFVFLWMDALHAASEEFKRARVRLISPMDIRTGLISFQNDGASIDLPLADRWGPKEQYRVWKALQENVGGGTPDYLGLRAAEQMIIEDQESGDKDRLRLVLVSADGDSDDVARTLRAKEELKARGVVVKAAGIGPHARAVEATYFPDGSHLDGFDEVPDWAADVVLAEVKKLHPRKVKA